MVRINGRNEGRYDKERCSMHKKSSCCSRSRSRGRIRACPPSPSLRISLHGGQGRIWWRRRDNAISDDTSSRLKSSGPRHLVFVPLYKAAPLELFKQLAGIIVEIIITMALHSKQLLRWPGIPSSSSQSGRKN